MSAHKIFFLFLLISIGCSSAQQKDAPLSAATVESVKSESKESSLTPDKKRIMIYNAYYVIESDNPEKTAKEIAAIASSLGGFVVSTGTYAVVIRVEAAKFEAAMELVEKTGDVESKRIYSEDVTEAYRDTQLRLDSKLKARDRYLELLKKAENVNSALAVEKELERLNSEIEEMKGRLKRMSHYSEYSTITVNLKERVKPGPLGYVFIGTWKVIKWLFVRN